LPKVSEKAESYTIIKQGIISDTFLLRKLIKNQKNQKILDFTRFFKLWRDKSQIIKNKVKLWFFHKDISPEKLFFSVKYQHTWKTKKTLYRANLRHINKEKRG